MLDHRILGLLLVFICLMTAGCAHQSELQNVALAEPIKTAAPTSYTIRPGDQLDIKFFYNPELNEAVSVRPDGKISLQLVDEVQAAGLTPAQLDDQLTQAYSRELKKPVLTVIVRELTATRVYVGGEVNQQREIPLPANGKLDVLQAVFQAGGMKDTAMPEHTIIIRKDQDREPFAMRVDLNKALVGKGSDAQVNLLPDDIVYVPRSRIAEANVFVRQYVEQLLLFRGVSVGFGYNLNNSNNNN